jgi:hypothetical protein
MRYAIFFPCGLLVTLLFLGCSSKKFKRDLFVLNKTKTEFSDVIVIDNGVPVPLKRRYDGSAKKYGDSWNGECCSEQVSHLAVSATKPDGARIELGTCEVKVAINHGVYIVIERDPDHRLICAADVY